MVVSHLEHGDTQRVSQPLLVHEHSAPAPAIDVHAGQGVQLGVHPVEALVQKVWGRGGRRESQWGERDNR